MRVAILGAGFCGVATAFYMSEMGVDVTLFDARGIAGGASGVAPGLFHAYAGAHAKRNRFADEGIAATTALLEKAESQREVSVPCGMFRPAVTEQQQEDFTRAAEAYEDVEWTQFEGQKGIFIRSARLVRTRAYLEALFACTKATLQKREIKDLSEVAEFDRVVIALGAQSTAFPETEDLPLRVVKGQLLELVWPEGLAPLPFILNGEVYVVMSANQKRCIVGSTFEKRFETAEPTPETVIPEIRIKLQNTYPALVGAEVVACHAGLRAVGPNHLPLLHQINERCWVLTGMGSKGLLYHALYSLNLARGLA